MPKIKFSTESVKSTNNFDYPKLKLEQNERARIVCLQDEPEVEYVHTLQAPQVVDGEAVMETNKTSKGVEYQANKFDFKGRVICKGDFGTLENKGSDPVNCPMCKMAKDHPDWMKAPQRRFAMHVVRYKTQSGKFDVQTPFQVEVLVWSFTDRTYGKLVEFMNEHGDLKAKDLMLGPCENKNWQKYDIAISSKAEWLAADERKKLTAETFKENQIPDLRVAIGTVKADNFLTQDLGDIEDKWREVEGLKPAAGSTADLSTGLDGLLDSKPAANKTTESQNVWSSGDTGADETSSDDLLGGLLGSDDTKSEEAPAKASDPDDFDSLLNSI